MRYVVDANVIVNPPKPSPIPLSCNGCPTMMPN